MNTCLGCLFSFFNVISFDNKKFEALMIFYCFKSIVIVLSMSYGVSEEVKRVISKSGNLL